MSQEPAPYQADTDDDLLSAPERWEKGMAEIADLLADELRQAGVTRPSLPGQLAYRLCRDMGGTTWYIPKGAAMRRALRDLAIHAEHDGTRHGPGHKWASPYWHNPSHPGPGSCP